MQEEVAQRDHKKGEIEEENTWAKKFAKNLNIHSDLIILLILFIKWIDKCRFCFHILKKENNALVSAQNSKLDMTTPNPWDSPPLKKPSRFIMTHSYDRRVQKAQQRLHWREESVDLFIDIIWLFPANIKHLDTT